MTEDRSLDDFLGGDASSEAGDEPAGESADANAAADEASNGDDRSDPADGDGSAADAGEAEREAPDDAEAAVDPAVATYRWDPGGLACPDCGETVDRLWFDDGAGGQVCADCKEW